MVLGIGLGCIVASVATHHSPFSSSGSSKDTVLDLGLAGFIQDRTTDFDFSGVGSLPTDDTRTESDLQS